MHSQAVYKLWKVWNSWKFNKAPSVLILLPADWMRIDARMCHGVNLDRHRGRQGLPPVFGFRSFLAIAYHGIAIGRVHPQHAFVLVRSAGRLVSERHPRSGRGLDFESTAVCDTARVTWVSAVKERGHDCERSPTRRCVGHLHFDLAVSL
jgi:hypothetical protein